MYIYWKKV